MSAFLLTFLSVIFLDPDPLFAWLQIHIILARSGIGSGSNDRIRMTALKIHLADSSNLFG